MLLRPIKHVVSATEHSVCTVSCHAPAHSWWCAEFNCN